MSEKEIDAVLVKKVQAGDKKAFELLVLKYQRRIMRLLSRFFTEQADIEDVAQEAFIKAYRALPKFRNESAFYTWLYRIAINTAKNHLQSKHNKIFVSEQFESDEGETFSKIETLTDGETPESKYINQEIVNTINKAIDSLSEDLRQAIVLREIEGMSYEDIAQIMDCPIGTVRSRIFRAREAISARLKPVLGDKGSERW